MCVSSSRVNTLPHGFDGVFTRMNLVFLEKAASSAAGSYDQSGACSFTYFSVAWQTFRMFRW
jgi:hypothetical protein